MTESSISDNIFRMASMARRGASILANTSAEKKSKALKKIAEQLERETHYLIDENKKDLLEAVQKGLSEAVIDRITLNESRIKAMANGVRDIAEITDKLGETIEEWERPSGIKISKVRVPLGVIAIIYESRPNVTADAAALCIKSGNASILRCGSDSFFSSLAIMSIIQKSLEESGLPSYVTQLIETRNRDAVGALLKLDEYVDVIIPRGGKELIKRVAEESKIPVLKHLDGICHCYIEKTADLKMAERVVANAKMRRTGICNATETLLIDRAILQDAVPHIVNSLIGLGCEVRADDEIAAFDARIKPATSEDWDTEYLAPIISVKTVSGIEEAIAHINAHSSHHTESIMTSDASKAERFMNEIDSAIVMHNTSTQFSDGGEFGFGAEIGISTGKIHARGPVGVLELTTYKYKVVSDGALRPL